MTEPVPYQCFISYARADNDDHDGVVDRLKKELAGRFEAATGSKLSVFLDKESIGWGERWREKIADAILGSTLFIPVVTMRYFNRPACRDEFSAFYSAAVNKGVPDLILPIILAGARQITPDHPDELVRAVEQLNHKPIYDAFEAGYESSDWKRQIGAIVDGLQNALARAAERLANSEPSAPTATANEELISEVDEQTITGHLEAMTTRLTELEPLFEKLTGIVTNRIGDRDLAQMSAGQRAFLFGALAGELRDPAAEFGEKAANLESTARRVDAEFRAIVAELYDINPQQTEQELAELRSNTEQSFSDAQESFAQINELEKSLRVAALASVKLRRALYPMTTGLRSMSTAMTILSSWQSIQSPGTSRR